MQKMPGLGDRMIKGFWKLGKRIQIEFMVKINIRIVFREIISMGKEVMENLKSLMVKVKAKVKVMENLKITKENDNYFIFVSIVIQIIY